MGHALTCGMQCVLTLIAILAIAGPSMAATKGQCESLFQRDVREGQVELLSSLHEKGFSRLYRSTLAQVAQLAREMKLPFQADMPVYKSMTRAEGATVTTSLVLIHRLRLDNGMTVEMIDGEKAVELHLVIESRPYLPARIGGIEKRLIAIDSEFNSLVGEVQTGERGIISNLAQRRILVTSAANIGTHRIQLHFLLQQIRSLHF